MTCILQVANLKSLILFSALSQILVNSLWLLHLKCYSRLVIGLILNGFGNLKPTPKFSFSSGLPTMSQFLQGSILPLGVFLLILFSLDAKLPLKLSSTCSETAQPFLISGRPLFKTITSPCSFKLT